jgi:murein L,D-transpeptidase YcbB/YkuD
MDFAPHPDEKPKRKRRTKAELEAEKLKKFMQDNDIDTQPVKRKRRTKAEMAAALEQVRMEKDFSESLPVPDLDTDYSDIPEESLEKQHRTSAKQKKAIEQKDKIMEAVLLLQTVSPCKTSIHNWMRGELRREGFRLNGEGLPDCEYAYFRVVLPFTVEEK